MLDEHQIDLLSRLAKEIWVATEDESASEDKLRTSADLARQFGLKHDFVKKQLKLLKATGLILPIGLSPKRYRFDAYRYRVLLWNEPEDQALYALLKRLQSSPEETETVVENLNRRRNQYNSWKQSGL